MSIRNLSDRRFVARGLGWLGSRAAYFERTIAFESTEPNDLNAALGQNKETLRHARHAAEMLPPER